MAFPDFRDIRDAVPRRGGFMVLGVYADLPGIGARGPDAEQHPSRPGGPLAFASHAGDDVFVIGIQIVDGYAAGYATAPTEGVFEIQGPEIGDGHGPPGRWRAHGAHEYAVPGNPRRVRIDVVL